MAGVTGSGASGGSAFPVKKTKPVSCLRLYRIIMRSFLEASGGDTGSEVKVDRYKKQTYDDIKAEEEKAKRVPLKTMVLVGGGQYTPRLIELLRRRGKLGGVELQLASEVPRSAPGVYFINLDYFIGNQRPEGRTSFA